MDSYQQLTLTEAHNHAVDEPTRAVAMIKPLVGPAHWQAARDVAAAARANGVAYALAASPHTLALELSRDGNHALAAGDDGIVRIYDLVHRSVKTLYDAKVATPARFGDADHTVVLFRDTHITLVDVATGTHRDVEVPTAIAKLEVSGPIAYWLDPQHAVWKLDVAGGAPQKLVIDEPIEVISPSPDGRWVALAGRVHLMLLDRTDSTLPAETVTEGAVRELAWAADASHVVGLTDEEYIDVAIQPTPNVIHRYIVGTRRAVAYSNGRAYSTSATGVAVLQRDESRARAPGGDYTLGVREARGGTVIAGRPLAITLMSDDGDRTLASPLRLARVEASPHGPFVIGASDKQLLVWDLDDLQPRHAVDAPPTGALFVTGDALIVTYIDEPAQWLDLRTNKAASLGVSAAVAHVAPAPDGQRAVAIDATHHARIVAPVGEPLDIDGDIDHAMFVDDHRILLATSQGIVRIDDRKLSTPLVQRKAPVAALAMNGSWIAAAYADRVLWRTSLETKTDTKLQVEAAPAREALAIGGEGDVVFGVGNEIRIWHPDGSAATLATLGRAVATLAYCDPVHVLAVASDGAAAIVGTKRANDVEPLALPIASPTLTRDGALAASLAANGALEIVDPLVRDRWAIAQSRAPQQLVTVQISPDGKRVLATTSSGVLVWTLQLPTTAETTAPWLDQLTNALADHGPSGPLGWR
jgi:WD40 repeat protein